MAGPKYDPFTRRTSGLSLRVWRAYNMAMEDWLSGISKDKDGQTYGTIPVLYATPEKAFARREAPLNEGRPDIPMISFYLTSFDLAFDRVNGFLPSFIPFERVRVPGSDRVRSVPRMLPVNISYQVNLWAKHVYEVQLVDWDLVSRMRPYSNIHVYGADCPVRLESASDSSDLEPGSTDDRQIRRDYSFRVEGWVPLPYTEDDRLKKITIGMTDDVDAGDEPEGTNDDELFPEWTLPADAAGGVLVTTRFQLDTTTLSPGTPGVYDWEESVPLGGGTGSTEIIGTGAVRLPDGSVMADRGAVAFVFDLAHTPPWNPTPGAPLLVWQPRDETHPSGARYGSIYLYRRVRVPEGNEFHGVVPNGYFVEPARVTADGASLYEPLRVVPRI